MRDLVTLFVEASLAKGEWLAALNALQSSTSSCTKTYTPASVLCTRQNDIFSNYRRIARTLAQEGNWAAALATLRCAPSTLLQNGSYSHAYIAQRVRVYHQVLLSFYKEKVTRMEAKHAAAPSTPASSTDASARPDATDTDLEKVLRDVFAMAAEAFDMCPSVKKDHIVDQHDEGRDAVMSNASPLSPSLSSAPPLSSSTLSEASTSAVSAAELIEWCQTQLEAAPVTSYLSAEQKGVMVQQLRALSQAALQGAVSKVEAPPALSEKVRRDDAPTPPSMPVADDERETKQHSQGHSDRKLEEMPTLTLRTSAAVDAARLSPAAVKTEAELQRLLRSTSPSWNDWSTALRLLSDTPADRFTPHMFTALIRLLANRGRRGEVESLVHSYVFPADPNYTRHMDNSASPSSKKVKAERDGMEDNRAAYAPTRATASVLAADAVVLKSIAEASRRLRCPSLAQELLDSRGLRAHLTPSAAVPLVMVLRDAEAYATVIRWWEELRQGEETTRYPLLQHAKLSSYVASCVLRRARNTANAKGAPMKESAERGASWVEVLRVFAVAERQAPDPALVLLFQLRLLRQLRQWEVAIRLFANFSAAQPMAGALRQRDKRLANNAPSSRAALRHRTARDVSERPSSLESVIAVLTEERAEQWIPGEALRNLRQRVNPYKRKVK
ncbi:hypothetical protein NQL31_006428 [Lotmaria passim]